MPTIEGVTAATWIDRQKIFFAQNVYGEKIFHRVQDYSATEFYAFHDLYFLNTMSCGSEWACWDGTKWVYHRLNGAQGSGSLTDANGSTVWSGALLIEPMQNPADGLMAIGHDTKSPTTATTIQPWPGGSVDDFVLNLRSLGLYRFTSSFTDPLDGTATTNSIYRVLGAPIANSFGGIWGGVVGHRNGTVTALHEGIAAVTTLNVANGAFAGTTSWTGIANTRTGGRDSIPGRVFLTFVYTDTGESFQTQRNIGFGSVNGAQMFLLDPADAPGDTMAPTASVTAPTALSTVFGTVAIRADASDNVAVTSVQLSIDGQSVGAAMASAPYLMSWSSSLVVDGNHAIQVVARDAAGNSTTSPAVVVVANSAPAITITAPADLALVTGSVTISASITSNSHVTRVDFARDAGTLVGTSTANPASVVWDTTALAQGTAHTVYATAYAENGTATTSTFRTVVIRDTVAPSVALTTPVGASAWSGTVSLAATAGDNVGVTNVEFLVDGQVVATDAVAPHTGSWNTAAAALGSHVITARAYDRDGNVTTSAPVTVSVVDTKKPTVSITSPGTNTSVGRGSTIAITANATDDRSIARVEFLVNNVLKCTASTAPYSCRWTVPSPRNVRYTLKARAIDSSGNVSETSVVVTSN